jgi:hypothetical protein
MYSKDGAMEIKQTVNKSTDPILVEDCANYLNGYRKLKYYYSNDSMKQKHVIKMEQEQYKLDSEERLYDTLYDDLFKTNEAIKVIQGVFYKSINSII